MRKVTSRMLLLLGMSTLVLLAVTRPTLATKSAHFSYACDSKRSHWCCKAGVVCKRPSSVSRQPIRPYRPPLTSNGTEQVLQCLFWQPFVNCNALSAEIDPPS
jgi:hypothetical protein